jgi:hypothetical protein
MIDAVVLRSDRRFKAAKEAVLSETTGQRADQAGLPGGFEFS